MNELNATGASPVVMRDAKSSTVEQCLEPLGGSSGDDRLDQGLIGDRVAEAMFARFSKPELTEAEQVALWWEGVVCRAYNPPPPPPPIEMTQKQMYEFLDEFYKKR